MALNPDELSITELEKLLNPRQREFTHYLLDGFSQSEAAIKAGYSPRSAASQATELLKNPKVAAYRRALARAVLENLGLTPEAISLRLFEVYERCMQKKPVQEWDSEEKAWKDSGVWQFDAKGATRVLELLGKNAGMFSDKVNLSGAAALRIETSGSIDEGGA